MKHTLWLLLLALLIIPTALAEDVAWNAGDSVFFGRYEQNGIEPIEWIVIDVQDNTALLISRYALDCKPYHTPKQDVTWADSSLRAWLNDEFYRLAFTEQEASAILPTKTEEGQNPEWGTNAGCAAEDQVFLLSHQEASQYLLTKDERKVAGTEYARANGARFLGFTTIGIGETDWWLRSPGKVQHDGCFVDIWGQFGTKSVADKIGIRPAIRVRLAADFQSFSYAIYQRAREAYGQSRYAEAAELYKSLGEYSDSPDKAIECLYLEGCSKQDASDWAAAIAIFDSLGDYDDSYQRGRACRHAQAVQTQEAGDFELAIQLLTELGQYQDGMSRLMACFAKTGTPVYYLSASAINAGLDTGYSRANAITGSDPHFGWRMGRFFMTDFTRVTESEENPVFIKTIGDKVTLWFDLEQNIDALNGSVMLVLNADANGYDQHFGVQRTNFGRGTLIVRHTNYQNAKKDPVIYTDYLLAKGTTGANTRVELFEEGDYEVALDYELADNEITHILNKHNNYRVFFRFSVRNGNCMVYPFDILTGEELTNTSITENGFSLDLARSRYLDINVKRSVIMERAGGIVEDERFNRPARDGDQYTQEGIYTITVSNRYTGETTTKTIFVGTEDLLMEYIDRGFSTNNLSK